MALLFCLDFLDLLGNQTKPEGERNGPKDFSPRQT
jgi:hypothetical protein